MNGLKREKHLFEEAPMAEAILSLAIPAVMGQIILVIYNMAIPSSLASPAATP